MEQSTNNSVSEELKIKTTDEEPFNICLTNNYAFLKIFKKEENVKGFLIDLLNLKEKQRDQRSIYKRRKQGRKRRNSRYQVNS